MNILGYVAENMLNDDVRFINYDQLDDYLSDDNAVLIDVRSPKEFENGAIPSAINMDVDTLRDNLDFFDNNKKYVIYCQIGLRGYLAQRILRNNNINSVNLNGGYGLWKPVNS